MLGFPTDKTVIDSRSGFFAVTLRDLLRDIENAKLRLDSITDQALESLGYTAPEVITLRAAYADMSKLARIYRGADTQAAPSDFNFHAKNLTGLS